MFTYWKIRFDDGLDGFGWLKFNERMESEAILDATGNVITIPVGYTPVEFDTRPDWDQFNVV